MVINTDDLKRANNYRQFSLLVEDIHDALDNYNDGICNQRDLLNKLVAITNKMDTNLKERK